MTEKKKWIDGVRGIGICLMTVAHVMVLGDPKKKFLYGFTLQIFFVLSGYLYNDKKYEGCSVWQIVRPKIGAYLIPYVVLIILNMPLKLLMDYKSGGTSAVMKMLPEYLIKGLLYSDGNSMPNCAPLWFLPTLLLAYILLAALLKLTNRIVRWIAFFACIIVGYLANAVIPVLLPWHLQVVPLCTALMMVGWYYRQKQDYYRWYIALLWVVLGCLAIYTNEHVSINELIIGNPLLFMVESTAIPCAIIWIFKRYEIKCRLLSLWGKNTLLMLGINLILNEISLHICGESWYLRAIINMIIYTIASLIWMWLKKRMQWLKVLGF